MLLDDFSFRKSILHGLDPRIKLIGLLVFSIATALAQGWPPLLLALGTAFILTLFSCPNFHRLAGRLAIVNGFIIFLWLVLPFSTFGGEILFRLGPFTARSEGLHLAATITLKSNAIVLATIALAGSSSTTELAHALHHLYVPDKLVFLFSMVIRYIELISLESQRLRNAMKARGFVARSDRHSYRTYAHLVAMLLLRSVERSERIYRAMLCRGFDGTFYTLDHFAMTSKDVAALLLIVSLSASIHLI